jgi:hypothetical protein
LAPSSFRSPRRGGVAGPTFLQAGGRAGVKLAVGLLHARLGLVKGAAGRRLANVMTGEAELIPLTAVLGQQTLGGGERGNGNRMRVWTRVGNTMSVFQ